MDLFYKYKVAALFLNYIYIIGCVKRIVQPFEFVGLRDIAIHGNNFNI